MTLRSLLPGALLWGPTPWEQQASQPWDVAIRTSTGKVLVVENKGIQDDGSVHIQDAQLADLCRLQAVARSVGLPDLVLYGLPALGAGLSWSMAQVMFPQAQLMYRPETLRSILKRWSPYGHRPPRPITKVERLTGFYRIHFQDPLTFAPRDRRRALFEVLHGIPRCARGARLGPGWDQSPSDPSSDDWLSRLRRLAAEGGREVDETPPQVLWWPRA